MLYIGNSEDAGLNLQARKNGGSIKSVFKCGLDGTTQFNNQLISTATTRCNRPSDFWTESKSLYYAAGIGGLGTAGSNRLSLFTGGYRNSSGTWTADRDAGSGAARIELDPRGAITFDIQTDKSNGSSTSITNRAKFDGSSAYFYLTVRASSHNFVQEGSGYYTNSGSTSGQGYADRKNMSVGSGHSGFDSGAYPVAGTTSLNCFHAKPLWTKWTSGGSMTKVYGFRVNSACAPNGSAYANVAESSGIHVALSNQSGRRIRQIECTGNASSDIPSVNFRYMSLKSADYFNAAVAANPEEGDDPATFAAEHVHVPATPEEVGTGIYMNETGSMCFARDGECVLELGNGKVIGNLLDKLESMESRIQQHENAS